MSEDALNRVLSNYSRPIAHMFQQLNEGRLGLILGAGVSKGLGFPDWPTLVDRISKHPAVGGSIIRRDADTTPLPILTQILMQHFKRKYQPDGNYVVSSERDINRLAAASFRKVIHECLYQDVPADDQELLERDRFFKYYIDVIRRSSMTVTYNFDDSLERILLHLRNPEERTTSRGFETITDARLQFRLSQGIIYHPNGFLPRNQLEAGADALVLSEDSFADQLIDTMAGHYSSLLHHLSKNTCLLVGLSLDDSTLRHLLRQNAKINPGHYHYIVDYIATDGLMTIEERQARTEANFEVFNLITLFLGQEDIAALGRILSSDWSDVRGRAEELGVRVAYCFYLTGVPGVGKTTTASYFKSLKTYDEWLDRRLPEMGKPYNDLTDEERDAVDSWVLRQVGLKNRRLRDEFFEKGVGITLVDRCVPDAIAFTPEGEWGTKAASLISAVSPGKSNRIVHPGHIIVLTGDPRELVVRAECSGKTSNRDYVEKLQKDTIRVYTDQGITHLNTRDMSVIEVVKSVARIIHLADYTECSIQGLLERHAGGGTEPNER